MSAQAGFRAAVLDPQAAVPEGLRDGQGRPAGKRFDVYRNNVAVGLTEALVTGFPVIHKLVGDRFFRAMAGVYLRTHPPASPLMMFYGEHMPQFLRRFGPAQSLPYLPDVARLELAMRESYHAADAVPVEAAVLGQMAPEALMSARVGLAPALRIVRSSYPVHGLYRFNMEPGAPKPQPVAETVLVTRPGFDPVQDPVSPADADFIEALAAGHPLGVALSLGAETPDLAALLGLLLRRNAITTLTR